MQTPEIFGKEAGRFLERKLYDGETLALIVETTKSQNDWNENDVITGNLNG